MRAWLKFGYDTSAKKYYGRLAVATGEPQPPETPRGWIPPVYAEVFDIHERPTHNYPMPMAEACLSLYEKTSDRVFLEAVERWATHVRVSLPANDGRGAYAEDYGRVIHFLVRASRSLKRAEHEKLAREVADEAIERLFDRRFRGAASRARRSEGMGIGLSIVDAIARGHGGRASAVNEPGGGARFTIALPIDMPLEDLP